MKSRNLIYLSSVFYLFAAHISATGEKIDNSVQAQSMLAVLYAQSSAEYEANNLQTFAGAKLALEKALVNKNWTAAIEQKEDFSEKPPAVILDIDETVLNNIPFQARAIIKGEGYPSGWIDWMLEEASTSVAGAKDFLEYAEKKGVKVFYVTNRDYRVLLLIGDQLGDFISLEESTVNMDSRQAISTKYKDMWGKKWFMITNPIYGRWEASLYNNEYPENEDELIKMRMKALKP